ncbi:hypothetical protein NQZ68_028175 [Dissostichus eleginoides]|nr:hypothetical protein NQZ68_028175 [Dissostichus eleginoides]
MAPGSEDLWKKLALPLFAERHAVWGMSVRKVGTNHIPHITNNRAFQPRDVSSSFSCQTYDLRTLQSQH